MQFLRNISPTTIVLFLIVLTVSACKPKKDKKSSETNVDTSQVQYAFEAKVYEQSLKTGDHHSSVVAINRMLLLDSTQTHLYDSLTKHYFALSNVKSAVYFAEKSLELDPGNIKSLELAAYIYFEGGSFVKAEEKFNKLYELTKGHKYLYQLSQIHAYMGDNKKANQIIDMVLNDPEADNIMVDLATANGNVQEVKIKAACWFVRANLQDGPKQALPYIKKALQLQPNFDIARAMKNEFEIQIEKQNMIDIERRIKGR